MGPLASKLIGVTGGIGSGKSHVAHELARCGYATLDADVLSRVVMAEPSTVQAISALFGSQVLDASGAALDRAQLRERVLAEEGARKALEAIVHPLIAQELSRRCTALQTLFPGAWVFYEASLLLETGQRDRFDAVVLVTAPLELRVKRLQHKRGLSPEVTQGFLKAQWTDEAKRPLCDAVLENDETLPLEGRVQQLLHELRTRFS